MKELQDVIDLLQQNASLVVIVVLLVLLTIQSIPKDGWGWHRHAPRGAAAMGRRARREHQAYITRMLTSDFVNSVEQRVYNGDIGRKDATEIYRILKKGFPIREMFPDAKWLKEQITRRLGKHTEAKLPDAVKKPVRRHMFDTGPERVIL